MARGFRLVEVNNKEENDILLGLVLDDSFCSRVLPVLRPEHFKLKEYRHPLRWIREYFKKYSKAPGAELQVIFDTERGRMNPHEAELLETFLDTLNKRHAADKTPPNWPYKIDRARDYIRVRAIEVLAEQSVSLAGRGDLDRAEKLVREFSVTETAGVNWTTPLTDMAMVQETIDRIDIGLFKLEGVLGELFGWWQRGWLISYFGATKKGKSWWLMETAMQAVVAGLRVVFISLEMQELDQSKRFYSNVSALPERAGVLPNPVWDCAFNQDNSCTMGERTNRHRMPMDMDNNPEWDYASNYRACTACKTERKLRGNYRVASWFEEVDKESYADGVVTKVRAFGKQYPAENLKMFVYPRGMATLEMLLGDLDRLEAVEDFIPDMVVVDYADLMKAREGAAEFERLDDMWKQLAALGGKRGCLMVTASQGNTKALSAHTMRGDMTAGTTRKLHHIDVGISLNQQGQELDAMMMRLAPIQGARHTPTPRGEVYVLQNFFLGQPYLDSFAPGAGEYISGTADVLT